MRRWNGWGDISVDYLLTERADTMLRTALGKGTPRKSTPLEAIIASVPPSTLPEHPLITSDPATRVLHARGQSLPDWVSLRSGRINRFPDGVAYPTSGKDVRALLAYSRQHQIPLIPYGGGTSVAGHINPQATDTPVLTVDMSSLSTAQTIDRQAGVATFGAGITGPQLEAALRANSLTLGHFPQSFEYSTLGGWIATRSSGQQSLGYGRIEALLLGATVETPLGTLELPPLPASAAGPDLRQLILGSEGRLGVITEATVQCTPLPEKEEFLALLFPSWESGIAGVRALVQAQVPLSMIRLSNPRETTTTLTTMHMPSMLESLHDLWNPQIGRCLAVVGCTGTAHIVMTTRKAVTAVTRPCGGRMLGGWLGKQWKKSRFRTPYLRNTLWEHGYAVDTVETAATWDKVPALIKALETTLQQGLEEISEQVYAFTHLSHLYRSGSSVYTTYLFRLAEDPDETLHRWQLLKARASNVMVAHGATISHHHGVGSDHAPYLHHEKGELGIKLLRSTLAHIDPDGLMNPGKLL